MVVRMSLLVLCCGCLVTDNRLEKWAGVEDNIETEEFEYEEQDHENDNPPGTDIDGDGWTEEEGDCDDVNRYVSPSAVESCDGLDNNCDGIVDNVQYGDYEYHPDRDRDGFGDKEEEVYTCEPAVDGYTEDGIPVVENGLDCDDTDPNTNPDAVEICNDDKDNDCDYYRDKDDCE